MVPLLDETEEIVGKGKECDEEFRIMFSDISTEEEDEGEEVQHQKENVDKMEDVTKLSFKQTLGKFIKHMKDPSTTQSGKKSDMQPLFKHKHTQEEETHRKREFVRWFGKSSIQDEKEEFSAVIPCWEPGWRRLDSNLKVDILKNERDGNLRFKKGHESDPIEEYRHLLKEYEQLVGKVGSTDDKRDEKSGEKDIKPGEKWIKIRKGTLLRDYQIRWRQGMYYLVERKHIKKNIKQTSNKKKAMYEDTNKARHSKLLVKKCRPLNVQRYLGNKTGGKMVKYKKSFRKRGEAVKEIRRILSHLKRKYLNEGTEDLMNKNNMKLEWTITKLTNHLKKKCQDLGLEVSDNEQNGVRELFRKYCLLFFETKLQNKENRLKKEEQDKYPLGLFRPKSVVNGDFDDELSEGSEKAYSDDDIFEEALIKEVFSFWKSDFQPNIGRDSEIRIFETKKEKPIVNPGKVICRKESRFIAESPTKPSNNKSKIKNKEEPLPENCRELCDLPPDLEESFFGSKKAVSTLHSKIPFRDKYLMKDKSYLGTSSQCSLEKYVNVISEMKLEGLIQTDDYEFLKDDEAIFPWDEIHIELLERPAYISKKEDEPPSVKYEAVSEEEDSWSDPDDVHLPYVSKGFMR
ncbi:uncharacterized protein isoform X1 [Rhodnius prolixus]|uniref:uncharacterized protein isoform X1 n=3 Tax=Rhodnius prolixus TaxID=13249 RepID=UPI003D18DFBC